MIIYSMFLSLLLIPVMECAPRSASTQNQHKVLLRAETSSTALPASADRHFVLEMKNLDSKVITIVKPMFPNGWVVKRRYWDGNEWQSKELYGGAGSGVPSQGYPDKYEESDYVSIKPSDVYRITRDLNWYLAFPDKTVLPGVYELRFFYRYQPSADESDLALLTDRIESNTLKVEVLPDP